MFEKNNVYINVNDLLSGEAINLAYMPVLVPVGVIGNILSFLVSIDSLF